MGDLSPNFHRSEFACKGAGQPGHQEHHIDVAPELVVHLQRLRDAKGRPLAIISGHRCSWWNDRVPGAAPNSRHVWGDAADIAAGYATVADAEAAGFNGIGYRGQWAVHVDTRPTPARWSY